MVLTIAVILLVSGVVVLAATVALERLHRQHQAELLRRHRVAQERYLLQRRLDDITRATLQRMVDAVIETQRST